jgi:hypothetical protein
MIGRDTAFEACHYFLQCMLSTKLWLNKQCYSQETIANRSCYFWWNGLDYKYPPNHCGFLQVSLPPITEEYFLGKVCALLPRLGLAWMFLWPLLRRWFDWSSARKERRSESPSEMKIFVILISLPLPMIAGISFSNKLKLMNFFLFLEKLRYCAVEERFQISYTVCLKYSFPASNYLIQN